MQDRSYAIALVVILAICCLGIYVAISGFLNSSPLSLTSRTITPGAPATLVVVVLNTLTPVATATADAAAPFPTSPPLPTPLGGFQTTAASTAVSTPPGTPSPTPKTVVSIAPTVPPAAPTQPCSGFAYCATARPPDPRTEIGGDMCPRNYIIGRVLDVSGKGVPNIRVRFRIPSGEVSSTQTKDARDEVGKYDIPALGANPAVWIVWLTDAGGGRLSPDFPVIVPQSYSGSGNCPTRVDFKAQR